MKYFFSIFLFFALIVPISVTNAAQKQPQKPDYRGFILLQVQSYGRLWYVPPIDSGRYYIKNADEADILIKKFGVPISQKELNAFPTKKGTTANSALLKKYGGRFIWLNKEVWYIHPKTGKRSYLGKINDTLFRSLSKIARGVTDAQLRTIPMNDEQVVPDTAFASVASARLHNGARDAGQFSDAILPIASLTKLMTALVLFDQQPRWGRMATITESQIAYPKRFVGDDTTSEIFLKSGQQVSIDDLWTALLVSSSNQAAITLVENVGFSEKDFVFLMNKKARELGLSKTVFFDVAGLDAHTVSTAAEMAVIAEHAFAIPKIAQTSSLKEARIIVQDKNGIIHTHPIQNRNYSVLAFEPDGVKTGFLIEAQRNVALKKGATIIVVLHARSMKERNTIIKQLL